MLRGAPVAQQVKRWTTDLACLAHHPHPQHGYSGERFSLMAVLCLLIFLPELVHRCLVFSRGWIIIS